MTQATTDPAATLAAIIREADGRHDLSADALACAILAHPASQWGPVLPVPTDVELRADFYAWYQDTYGEPPLGIPLGSDVIKLARHLLQRWSPQPAAPWPRLSEKPPNAEDWGSLWEQGYRDGWNAARAQVELQREQAGVSPTPVPALPQISDQLIRWVIRCVLDESGTATEAACMDRSYNPVPRIRARLTEILQLAAQNEAAKRPAS